MLTIRARLLWLAKVLARTCRAREFAERQGSRFMQRRGRQLVAGRFVIATLAIASFGHSTPSQAARITGTVRDSKGTAVGNAQVKLQAEVYSATTTTDSKGNFAFEEVSATKAQIIITAKGMQPFERHWDELSAMSGNLTMYPNVVLRPKRGACGIRCWMRAVRTVLHGTFIRRRNADSNRAHLSITSSLDLLP